MKPIPLRLGLQQRVLADYRAPFFDALAEVCRGGLGLFVGQPRADEMIETKALLRSVQLTQGYNVHIFSGSLYVYWQIGLVRWLEQWQPEALILETNPRNLCVFQAVRWMKSRRRPVVGWGLGAPSSKRGMANILQQAIRRRFILNYDALITYSHQGAEEYQRLGFPAERIFVAPNAVVPSPRHPLPQRPSPAADFRPTVLFVGRLQKRKRVDLLLRACSALEDTIRPRLWVVGDGPARRELETLAQSVYPEASFLGARRGSELEPFFKAADLFVLPGTGGLALQQAMAHGLPVIAAEADGTQSDLVRSKNGWRVQSGDLNGLIVSLSAALSDISMLRRMGEESYRIVREEINLEKMVEVFVQAVRSVWSG